MRRRWCIRCKKEGKQTPVVRGRNLCGDHLNAPIVHGVQVKTLSPAAERRIADHIDGYDRDDLGESPDY